MLSRKSQSPFSLIAPLTPLYDGKINEITNPRDLRESGLSTAVLKELDILIEKGTQKLVSKSGIPLPSGGRIVLDNKDEVTNREIWKARFGLQGYQNKVRNYLVHKRATAKQQFSRPIIVIVAVFRYHILSTDVSSAFLQNAEKLMGDVFINPPKKLCPRPDIFLKLSKPLNGLADSRIHWGRALKFSLVNNMAMESAISDVALFFKKVGDRVAGICAT